VILSKYKTVPNKIFRYHFHIQKFYGLGFFMAFVNKNFGTGRLSNPQKNE